jgi:hypothetical protein
MTNKEHAVKAGRVGGYTALSTTIASVTPGIKELPIELGATIVAVAMRIIEAVIRRRFKFEIFS